MSQLQFKVIYSNCKHNNSLTVGLLCFSSCIVGSEAHVWLQMMSGWGKNATDDSNKVF